MPPPKTGSELLNPALIPPPPPLIPMDATGGNAAAGAEAEPLNKGRVPIEVSNNPPTYGAVEEAFGLEPPKADLPLVATRA